MRITTLIIALAILTGSGVVVSNYSDVVFKADPMYGVNVTLNISEDNPSYPGYGDGLSRETVHRFSDAITVENGRNTVVCVKFVSGDSRLKFYTDEIGPSYILEVKIDPGEKRGVGVEINTSDLGMGLKDYDYTVYVGECR